MPEAWKNEETRIVAEWVGQNPPAFRDYMEVLEKARQDTRHLLALAEQIRKTVGRTIVETQEPNRSTRDKLLVIGLNRVDWRAIAARIVAAYQQRVR